MSRSSEARQTGRRASFTERLARTSASHPWRTIAVSLLLIAAAVITIGALMSGALTADTHFRGKQPEAVTGLSLIKDRLTGQSGLSDFVIVRNTTATRWTTPSTRRT